MSDMIHTQYVLPLGGAGGHLAYVPRATAPDAERTEVVLDDRDQIDPEDLLNAVEVTGALVGQLQMVAGLATHPTLRGAAGVALELGQAVAEVMARVAGPAIVAAATAELAAAATVVEGPTTAIGGAA
jgi:hypothetical protein